MTKFTKGCLLELFCGKFEILKILSIIYAAAVNLHRRVLTVIYTRFLEKWGTAVAQWLRCFATNRTVEFFIDIIIPNALCPWGPSSRNEYPVYFLGVNVAGA
jgi:hypothetical protein